MKKFILLLLVLLPFLNSCSGDSSNSNAVAPEGTRLKKTVVTERTNGYGSTIYSSLEFFYNGNKLYKTVNASGTQAFYTYTGDLITKINSNSEVTSFTYNTNDKLESMIFESSTGSHNYTYYTYNSDGSISIDSYFVGASNVPQDFKTRKVFFENNNVVKVEEYINHSTTANSVMYYSFDSKESPGNGVLGYSKLAAYENGPNARGNNVLTYGTGLTAPNVQNNFSYVYNSNGYPKTGVQTSTLNYNTTWTSEYTYE